MVSVTQSIAFAAAVLVILASFATLEMSSALVMLLSPFRFLMPYTISLGIVQWESGGDASDLLKLIEPLVCTWGRSP